MGGYPHQARKTPATTAAKATAQAAVRRWGEDEGEGACSYLGRGVGGRGEGIG